MDIKAMHRNGMSIRKIARATGLHRMTVRRHLDADSLPQYHKEGRRPSILDPYRSIITDYLDEDSYQATWIFERLQRMGYKGGYTTVRDFVLSVKEQKARIAYVRFETEPGLQAQVDWGDFLITEPDGTTKTVFAFVMALGYCRALYVEFVESRTLEVFMDCHIHAFEYLGGVPQEILYDRMKHVVIRTENGHAVFNTEFAAFCCHYGFTPKACPAYSPHVKGKVERPITYVRERFWRGYRFTALATANTDVQAWLRIANARTHGTHHQPVDARWMEERPCLTALPCVPYDTSYKAYRKVYKDCQLSFNGNRYLVPPRMVGRRVLIKKKGDTIRIYHDDELLFTCQEPKVKGRLLGDSTIYLLLGADREQVKRKYGKAKGRATRGLTTASLFEVATRPLAEYERLAGGTLWNS